MDILLITQIIAAVLSAVVIYTVIGFIPGTDETSVLVPITLALVLTGLRPEVILAFFVASIITLSITNAIPTALVGLPGGVMSSPMMESSLYLKDKGLSAKVIKKMAAGAVVGILISLPISLILANLIAPLGTALKDHASLLFVFGAVFLALMSKAKVLSLISIIPISLLIMGLRHLYWGLGVVDENKNITVSFFLGITIGPLLVSLFELLNSKERQKFLTNKEKQITIPKNTINTLNPFKILTKDELKKTSLAALISNFFFVLSPVGITILLGEVMGKNVQDKEEQAFTKISTMAALIQSTYISGILIPLIAVGVPLSPVSIGPGIALFDAEPVFSQGKNIHHLLSPLQIGVIALVAALIAMLISFYLTNKYATGISKFVLTKIPHEAVLALFISFIVLLAFMDAGLINVFGVLVIGLFSGFLNRLGVNYGVQFMALYAAPWIVNQLVVLGL